jgi:hypothetical protein
MALEGQSRIAFNAAVYSNAAETLYRRHTPTETRPLERVQASSTLGSATDRERSKEHNHTPPDERSGGHRLDETVRHKLEQLAQALGLSPLVLDPKGLFRFEYNASTGLIDLLETQTRTVVLSISLKELAPISHWLPPDQVEGILADRAG